MALSKKKILHCSHLHGGAGQELLAQSSSDQSQALLQFTALSSHFFPFLCFFSPPLLEIPHGLFMAHAWEFSFLGAALLAVSCKHLTRGWGPSPEGHLDLAQDGQMSKYDGFTLGD